MRYSIFCTIGYTVFTLNRFLSADSIVPDPANPQSYNRYSYVNNNPINLVDPSGHFSCQIGNDGESAGVSVTECEDWVNQALTILGITETGMEIVENFWRADEDYGITIMIGGTFLGENINELLASSANFIFQTIYLKPENIKAEDGFINLLDPENWDNILPFAHEAIHAGQGFHTAASLLGEADAFRAEYELVKEMNALISNYNNAQDEGGSTINLLAQHPLAVSANSLGNDLMPWWSEDELKKFGEASIVYKHFPIYGIGRGGISWQSGDWFYTPGLGW